MAWAQAARVDADASMSRRTAIRTARRAAEATGAEEGEEAAEEEAEEEEEKSCCWAGSEPMWPPLLLLFAEREGRSLSLSCERRPVEVPPPPHALAHEYPPAPPTAAPSTLRAHLHPVAPPCMRKPHAPPTHHRSRRTSA
jgi:hypothetical protein